MRIRQCLRVKNPVDVLALCVLVIYIITLCCILIGIKNSRTAYSTEPYKKVFATPVILKNATSVEK
jgi:hypothetical protein